MPIVDPTEQGITAFSGIERVNDPTEGGVTAMSQVAGFVDPTENQSFDQPQSRGKLAAVKDFFTGEDQQTRATRDLPELGTGGLLSGEDAGTIAKVAPAILSTFEPQEIADLLSNNFSNIGIISDEKGNLIAANNKTGVQVVINQPGLSPLDLLQGLGVTAAFTPAAKAGSLATRLIGKAALVGGASAVTQAGLDLAGQAAGRTDEVSIGNIDKGDVAIAGLGGAAFETLFQGFAKAMPVFRQAIQRNNGEVTETIRVRIRNAATQQGIDPDTITDDVIRDFVNASDEATKPGQGGSLQGEREFGIDLTKAQREGTQSALRKEDTLFSRAPDIRAAKEAEQSIQGIEAGQRIQTRLGGAELASQQEAGGVIKQSVRQADEIANAMVRDAAESVGDAALTPDGFKGLLQASKNAIRGVEFDKSLPETAKLLKQITTTQKFLFHTKKITPLPVQLERLEQMRRRIGTAIGAAQGSDKRQLVIIKKSWDQYLDEAVQNALFAGDDTALANLKTFRSTFAEYAQKFRANPKRSKSGRRTVDTDKPGQVIESIVEANPTDIEVSNAIFGAGRTFGSPAGKNMVVRFERILGRDSEGFNAIRQAGFKRLILVQPDGKTISGQRTATAIRNALEKNGEMMRALYSAEEIALFQRFAAQLQRTQPFIQKMRGNPSGSGQAIIDSLLESGGKLARVFGMSQGNPIAFIPDVGITLSKKGAAREAVRPFEGVINAKPLPVAAGTALSVKEAN